MIDRLAIAELIALGAVVALGGWYLLGLVEGWIKRRGRRGEQDMKERMFCVYVAEDGSTSMCEPSQEGWESLERKDDESARYWKGWEEMKYDAVCARIWEAVKARFDELNPKLDE
ncbi:MAG: hypothetical protein M0P69_06040 [Bacteroidales bacterium]|nr:hypothetical protein [Bacteroidales bacterium]